MKFYMGEVLGLPEKVWPKTHAGSTVHSVLESLYLDKYRHHYDAIKEAGTIQASPAIMRLVRAWQYKTKVNDAIIADIDPMAMVVINHTNFLDEGAIERFKPEYEFRLNLKNGGVVKGFFDRFARYKDGPVIWDYKSQGKLFTEEAVLNSFQSLTYQLAVWRIFKELAEVRYVMLRFPPNKKSPTRHLQITPPATPAILEGFESYLEYMYGVVNNFGPEEARSNFMTDEGFCRNVCSFFGPKTYISIRKKATKELVKNYLPEFAPLPGDDEYAEESRHGGCPRFNS
jgi:hypothetical protein